MKTNQAEANGHTKVDIAASSSPDENWKTMDLAVLYDKDQCDLSSCRLDDAYRILE